MQTMFGQRMLIRSGLAAFAVAALAALFGPSLAGAEVVATHTAAPHQVQTHVVTPAEDDPAPDPAPAPDPGPAPAPAPTPSLGGATGPAADHTGDVYTNSNGRVLDGSPKTAGGRPGADDFPGTDILGPGDKPAPDLPYFGDANCSSDCLEAWHEYVGQLSTQVTDQMNSDSLANLTRNPALNAAYDALHDIDADIKALIYAKGGIPDVTNTPDEKEDGDKAGSQPQQDAPAPAPAPAPVDYGPPDAISGAGPYVPSMSDVLANLDLITGGPAMSKIDVALNGPKAEYPDGHGMFYAGNKSGPSQDTKEQESGGQNSSPAPDSGQSNGNAENGSTREDPDQKNSSSLPADGNGAYSDSGEQSCVQGNPVANQNETEDGGETRGCF